MYVYNVCVIILIIIKTINYFYHGFNFMTTTNRINSIFIGAVKWFIAINHIKKKDFVYIIYVRVLCIFIMYI